MNIKKAWFMMAGGGDPTTDSQGRQAFMVVGDSNAYGAANTNNGPVPGDGIMFDSTGSVLTPVDAAFVAATSVGTNRSAWLQFAIDYNADTGKKIVIVNNGLSGSAFFSGTAGLSWYTNGSLYAAAVTKTNDTLALMGISKLKAIFVVLGINDGTLNYTYVSSLIDRLQADYPDTPILMAQIGTDSVRNIRTSDRNIIRNGPINYTDVHFAATLAPLLGAGLYQASSPHPLMAGYNAFGSMYARWFKNSAYSKWARSIISCHFDDISSARKSLIETCVSALGANLFDLDLLGYYKTSTVNNVFVDWTFLQDPQNPGAATFASNDSLSTDGAATYFTIGIRPQLCLVKSTLSDFFVGVKVKTNSTPQGTAAALFGGQFSTTTKTAIAQSTTPDLNFASNNLTGINNTTDLKINDNTLYATGRNGTPTYAYKNGVQIGTASQGGTGTSSNVVVGGLNTANTYPNGTLATPINASYEYAVWGKFSTVNQLTVYNAMEALVSGW